MSSVYLLSIALAAILVLLFLVIKVKMSAFVAMILVSFITAFATKVPVEKIVPVLQEGMGKTLGSVMIVVGLGAILGRMIEVAGGADTLARSFTQALGQHRVVAAVTAAAFVLGIPVFFDVAFIVIAPIVFGFARVAKINPLKIGLPVAGTLLTVHVVLPPHPGPVGAAATAGADAGMMLIFGLPLAAAAALVGYFAAKRVKVDSVELLESPVNRDGGVIADGQCETPLPDDAGTTTRATVASEIAAVGGRVGTPTILILILLPILQIMLGTVGNMVFEEGSTIQRWFSMVGSSAIALLVGVLVAYLVIGGKERWSLEKRGHVMDSALPDVAVIVFVTGAGGVFANVLVTSGIGTAFADSLMTMHIPIILAGFLISAALRASQGSATVAMLTTAGLLAEPIAQAGYSQMQATLVTIAIGFGALGLSHINDSGFWIVTKYLGLSIKDGLRIWTVLSTVFGVAGFLFTWGAFALVS